VVGFEDTEKIEDLRAEFGLDVLMSLADLEKTFEVVTRGVFVERVEDRAVFEHAIKEPF
jgi:hypothetical protein